MGVLIIKNLRKFEKCIAFFLSLPLLAAAVYVIHDMQTAQGAGLYLSLRFAAGRGIMDLLTDAVLTVGLILLLILPVWKLSQQKMTGFLRFTLLFLGFMPVLEPGWILHPLSFEENLNAGGIGSIFACLFPFLAVLVFIDNDKSDRKIYRLLLSPLICAGAVAVMFQWGFLAPVLLFIMTYVLLWMIFDHMEKLCYRNQSFADFSWILYGGVFFRAVYQLLLTASCY